MEHLLSPDTDGTQFRGTSAETRDCQSVEQQSLCVGEAGVPGSCFLCANVYSKLGIKISSLRDCQSLLHENSGVKEKQICCIFQAICPHVLKCKCKAVSGEVRYTMRNTEE